MKTGNSVNPNKNVKPSNQLTENKIIDYIIENRGFILIMVEAIKKCTALNCDSQQVNNQIIILVYFLLKKALNVSNQLLNYI